jgi:molecular chaperone GrpE (heat shock protein)
MARVITELPAGAFTIGGKSRGPAVALGRNRYNKSQTIFLGEPELKQAIQDMGWPQPEDHTELETQLAAVKADLDQAQADVAHLEEKAQTLEKTVGFTSEPLERKIAELRDQLEQANAALEKANTAEKPKPKAKPKAKAKAKRAAKKKS